MRTRRPGLFFWLLPSLAFHVALVGLVALRSCRGDAAPVEPVLSGDVVTVDVASRAPLLGPPTTRPGGGAPAARHRSVRRAETPPPELAAVAPQEPRGREAAPPPPADAIAGPSRPIARAVAEGASGTGPGSRGGPGGLGAGRGEGAVPVVAGNFAFGKETRAAFKGVACFIQPGVLRIADVRGCAPAAIFYTNTFDVGERYQGEGFPGITDRSSWFMIEYTGVFTVGKDGTYEFRLHSDDGSYLFVDGAMVIENDGKHQPTSRSGSIHLKIGAHQLRLLYAQTTDRMALQLFVVVPGSGVEQLFTPRI